MFDRITYISDTGATIKLKEGQEVQMNLMNLHLVFEDKDKVILGEVDDLDGSTVKARFLGEIKNNNLIGGTIRKPSLDATIRVIKPEEIPLITGKDAQGYMKLGESPFYDGVPVYLDVNSFFSNHFAIFGNTGSGKSCGVSRLFQNMFHDKRLNPYKSNIFIFDSSGEYYNAFNNLNSINSNYHYRFYSTNEVEGLGEKLRLPVYLLNKDDLALLLQCNQHSQLPIIERMLKLALVFSQNDIDANSYKNHLIAKAIMSILYTNETSPNKRNEIFSILGSCSTPEFNLEAPVQGIGYVRKFRECFLIDNMGNFSESVLLTEYVTSFIKDEYDSYEPHGGVYYNLDTLEKALNFTLISEGWLRNEQTYGDAVTLRVRLHALIVGDNAKYFDYKDYVSLETYLSSMLINDGKKYQIVNVNLSDIDDDFCKVLTKIYSRLIFDFAKGLKQRASIPFHIVLEEAHRYIQNDNDRFLLGYNIFERIAKEGRKYGVILGIITQRPVELSDNVISQCTNFLIFKINHPMDLEYMRKTIPHITDDIIEKQKSLQSGTCLGFGLGFKIPLIIKLEMPNPSPLSGNCDVVSIWSGGSTVVGNDAPVEVGSSLNNSGVDISSFLGNNQTDKFDDSFIIPSDNAQNSGNSNNTNNESNNSNGNGTILTVPSIVESNNSNNNNSNPVIENSAPVEEKTESSNDSNPINNLVTITPVDNSNNSMNNVNGDTPLDESMINGNVSSEGSNESTANINGDTILDESIISGVKSKENEEFNPFAVSSTSEVQEVAETPNESSNESSFVVPSLISTEPTQDTESSENTEFNNSSEENTSSEETSEAADETVFALPEMGGADLTLDDDDDDDDDLDDKFDE